MCHFPQLPGTSNEIFKKPLHCINLTELTDLSKNVYGLQVPLEIKVKPL